jgi:hypothetical protein
MRNRALKFGRVSEPFTHLQLSPDLSAGANLIKNYTHAKTLFLPVKMPTTATRLPMTWGQYFKSFYSHNLRM